MQAVFDLSVFHRIHPGGAEVLLMYAREGEKEREIERERGRERERGGDRERQKERGRERKRER